MTFPGLAIRCLSSFVCLLLAVAVCAPAVADQADAARVASERINIAGRQRMLSQRMAKAVCFFLSGTDAARQHDIAFAAADEFDAQLQVLLNGSDALGFAPEAAPDARDALMDVVGLSQPFTASVRQLASGDTHAIPMRYVIERNGPTLARMNDAVGMIARSGGQGQLDAEKATTINLAGRQRMLSQKIAKAACMIGVRLDHANSIEELRAAMRLFDQTLQGLLVGDDSAGLLPPPNVEIALQLRKVERHWRGVLPILRTAVETGQIGEAEMATLARDLDVVLFEMNRAVGLWTAHAG